MLLSLLFVFALLQRVFISVCRFFENIYGFLYLCVLGFLSVCVSFE